MAADVGERLVIDLDLNAAWSTRDIARFAVSAIVAELILSECGEILLAAGTDLNEQDIRDAAEAIVGQANFDVDGLTEGDFTAAIEGGLDQLREILGIE